MAESFVSSCAISSAVAVCCSVSTISKFILLADEILQVLSPCHEGAPLAVPAGRAQRGAVPPAMRTLKLCLQRGDLATFAASCIVTSANDSLVGTLQPTYWRFISRHSVDGKLREAAGPELDEACLQIEPIQASHCRGIRRDITRWTGGVKHGASAPVRCRSETSRARLPCPAVASLAQA